MIRNTNWKWVAAGLTGGGAIAALLLIPALSRTASRAASPRPKIAPEARDLIEKTKAFLAILEAGQRAQLVMPFDSDERMNWTYVPADRKGLSLKAMNAAQHKAALRLLQVALSAGGYRKAETIRALEPILGALENNNPMRDERLYYFTIFGTPSPVEPWGLRYEGHHISLNWMMLGGNLVADTPQFFGANPARVPTGPSAGLRALAAEEDLGRALLDSLDEAQKKEAVLSTTALPDIQTGVQRRVSIAENRGLPYSRLRPSQRAMLWALIRQHANAQSDTVARRRLARIRKAGLQNIRFAWMGALLAGRRHYYRVQGPTFLIEYGNTSDDGNHVHTVWRDFKNDFGADLLGEHLKAAPHTHKP